MAVALTHLVAEAQQLLQPERFNDYCPNGLQVEGRPEVQLLVTGVTASQALLEAALDAGADAILVHHGYFWKNEPAAIVGMKRRRLGLLLQNEISLLAYHLPLDAHPELGNNAQLARVLGIRMTGGLQPTEPSVGNVGELLRPSSAGEFAAHVGAQLGRPPLLVEGGDHPIRTIAWCSGGAQGYIEQAAARGVDAYLTGEVSEQTVHAARELGIHFIAAGHHATERYGARAVGEWLAGRLGIEHRFIDIDNPA
ncbi:MAG: Nif3-like dinuclear metal center hexameric protein [Spongiibacteraceae bacterium]|jgi:dinuclear metal center YbgI/SA1388 family protein|nr:Nif3-like dinuclear metal center hexameric protein [Spongiibacteraceae bacterium]